jgi:hypothetical protein
LTKIGVQAKIQVRVETLPPVWAVFCCQTLRKANMTEKNPSEPVAPESGPTAGEEKPAGDGPEFTVTDQINAEHVQISQGGAGEIHATQVDIEQGGAFRIDAQQVRIEQGGAGAIFGEVVSLDSSAAGLIRAEEVRAEQSAINALYCDTAALSDSQAGLLVSRQVTGTTIRAGVLLASHVEGQVEAVLDTPRALLAGLAAGVGVGLVSLLGSLLRRRR